MFDAKDKKTDFVTMYDFCLKTLAFKAMMRNIHEVVIQFVKYRGEIFGRSQNYVVSLAVIDVRMFRKK